MNSISAIPGISLIPLFLFGAIFFSVKAYQRNRGIPARQFNQEYCLNNPDGLSFSRIRRLFSNPRLSQAQMKAIIDDCFADLETCPMGDQVTHATHKYGNNIFRQGIIRGIFILGGNNITREMIETMLSAPQAQVKWYFYHLVNVKQESHNWLAPFGFDESYVETLFLSKKLSARVYWENFIDLAQAFDASQYRDDILSLKKTGYRECQLFETILGSYLVTEEDITRLCYSKYDWLKEIALKHPLSISSNGVIIALSKGNLVS